MAEQAFHDLQTTLTQVPVLQLPAFDRAFVVECDALGFEFGASSRRWPYSLLQLPNCTTPHEVGGVRKGAHRLGPGHGPLEAVFMGRSFLVRTDHYNLKFLLIQHLTTIPQHQWAKKLLGFDFRVF
jgi:hypothetical protein